MANLGTLSVGLRAAARPRRAKRVKRRVGKQAELSRDRSRLKLWELRQRLKLKVRGNEEEMKRRKTESEKSLNPTFVPLMPSRKYAKMIRNPVNWSSVPLKPKYSRIDPKPRIYGKRFEVWEKKLGQSRSEQVPKQYQEAAQKMAESVAELRKDIAERAKELEARIGEANSGSS